MEKLFLDNNTFFNKINTLSIDETKKFLAENPIVSMNIFQEIQMRSRFIDIHKDISLKTEIVHLHSHSFFEIILCQNGEIEYLLDSKRYLIKKGDLLVISPETSHRPLFPKEMPTPYERIIIWIPTNLIDQLIKLWPDYQKPDYTRVLHTSKKNYEYLLNHLENTKHEVDLKKDNWELIVYGNVISLIGIITRMFENEVPYPALSKKDELIDSITAYIEENLNKKITISHIARHFHISESTAKKNFRNKLNVSIYHYITQRRLITAKSLMNYEFTNEEISFKVGFHDYSTFYRAFKKEYGISPKEYRELKGKF